MNDFSNKVHGCFLGVMIGDALGAPVEMMQPEDILAQNNGKAITGFDHSIRRRQYKSVPKEILPPMNVWQKTLTRFGLNKPIAQPTNKLLPEVNYGSTTDDWQLTDILRTSLIRRKRFDVTDVALAHVKAYETSTSGWGGTTRNGVKELQAYFTTQGHAGRSPFDPPVVVSGRGSGNGIAMKVTPLALMHMMTCGKANLDFDLLGHQCADLGKLTHSDPRAWAAAYALACTLIESNTIFDDYTAGKKDGVPPGMKVLDIVLQHLVPFERRYGSGGLKRFSSHLKVLLDDALLFGPIEELRTKIGTGCLATESVVFAIAVFLRHPLDFRAAILETVNSGGDTDTISGMVGALVGNLVGSFGIPVEWQEFSPEFNKCQVYAKEFYTAFSPT